MKNKTKLILYNAGIAATSVPLFTVKSFALLSNPIAAVAVGGLLAVACLAGNVIMCKQDAEITSEFLRQVDKVSDILPKLRQFKRHPIIGDECEALITQYDRFTKKKTTLETMCGDQNSYSTTNGEIEEVLFNNMLLVCKRILLLQSSSTHEDEKRHEKYIQGIVHRNDTLLTQYDELLEEVSQLGDDYNNSTSESLATITRTLREFRLEDESN